MLVVRIVVIVINVIAIVIVIVVLLILIVKAAIVSECPGKKLRLVVGMGIPEQDQCRFHGMLPEALSNKKHPVKSRLI